MFLYNLFFFLTTVCKFQCDQKMPQKLQVLHRTNCTQDYQPKTNLVIANYEEYFCLFKKKKFHSVNACILKQVQKSTRGNEELQMVRGATEIKA